jgi:hypothetical protein
MNTSNNLPLPAAGDHLTKLKRGGDERVIDGLASLVAPHDSSSHLAETLNDLSVSGKHRLLRSVAKNLAQGYAGAEGARQVIRRLMDKPDLFQSFALSVAEACVLDAKLSPARIQPETKQYLTALAARLVHLRKSFDDPRPKQREALLRTLRNIDREVVALVSEAPFIKAADYVALNAQHVVIAKAIKTLEQGILDKLSDGSRRKLCDGGIFFVEDVEKRAPRFAKDVKKLFDLGVVHMDEIPGQGRIYVYAAAKVNQAGFESVVPPRLREKIGDALAEEFNKKYSGKLRPLGISENRTGGVPTLLDRKRARDVATGADVSVSLVVLALKYLEQHGLVGVEHTGYTPTALGRHAGLGMRSVRHVQRRSELGINEASATTLDGYLSAVTAAREKWKMPVYSLVTKEGGAPWVYLLDELLIGNARIDTKLLPAIINEIKSQERCLVIASNTIQGDPAVSPKAMRTSLKPQSSTEADFRRYEEQIKFVRQLLGSMDQPVLKLHGRRELETAELKADVQRVRELEERDHRQKSDESKVKAALSRLNDIEARAGRKFNAALHAEVLGLMVNIIMPLESKLGRALFDCNVVRSKIGLNMNEIEIVRDMATLLFEDQKTGASFGLHKVKSLYGEFLGLPEIGAEYLKILCEVLCPSKEELRAGEIVARGGARVRFMSEQGAEGLTMMCLPEARFGIGEMMHPTEKLMSVVKSSILGGESLPDIVCVASTGQPIVSMTAGGQLIVSADTLQSSSFQDSYMYTEGADSHKRRRWNRGGENFAGCIAFSEGVHAGIKTDAYTIRLWNRKIKEVLDENRRLERPSLQTDIYATSDWQTGSPTSKPSTWLRGLFWAIATGHKEIVINGDVIQGQNYGRAVAEIQLTGLVGIEDQQAFVHALLNPVLDLIKFYQEKDPSWEIPRFTILAGNHETNSQSGKGAQGTWFLQTVAGQIESFYRGAFGFAVANEKVVYPKKFVDRLGIDVDYSHVVLDLADTTGFRIAAQHYVGVGGKGSSSVPPIAAAARWGRSMENELRPIHGFLFGHWHTQSVTQADGVFYAIFGANADKSGFEWHLGYPTTVPASGRVRLYSDRPPELMFVTDPYLRLQEASLMRIPLYRDLVLSYGGSLEGFVEHERARHQRRNQKAFSYQELKLSRVHSFLDAHRRIENAA